MTIQDTFGKEKQDKTTLPHADNKIAAACKSATKSLYYASLSNRAQVKDVACRIQKTWIENSF